MNETKHEVKDKWTFRCTHCKKTFPWRKQAHIYYVGIDHGFPQGVCLDCMKDIQANAAAEEVDMDKLFEALDWKQQRYDAHEEAAYRAEEGRP